MTITAKFAGRCTRCGGRFPVGEKIEWKHGAGAKHVKCPSWERGTGAEHVKCPVNNAGPKKLGQLWEECPLCGREPVYMPLNLCEHCWPTTPVQPGIDISCREPYRRGIGRGFGAGEDG